MASLGLLRCVALVRTDVSEELSASLGAVKTSNVTKSDPACSPAPDRMSLLHAMAVSFPGNEPLVSGTYEAGWAAQPVSTP
jgi:hypothetical protein